MGKFYFKYKNPFDPSDFMQFRKRIEYDGMKKIYKQSIDLFGIKVEIKKVEEIRIDTTIQEKNITFHADRELEEKVIEHCNRIA